MNTLIGILRQQAGTPFENGEASILRDAVYDSFTRVESLSEDVNERVQRLVTKRVSGRRTYAARKWQSVEEALRQFDALDLPTHQERNRHPFFIARSFISSLNYGHRLYKFHIARLRDDLIPQLPGGSLNYDIASRLIIRIASPYAYVVEEADIVTLLETTARNFIAGSPEIYRLARMRELSGTIEDEFPGTCIIRNGYVQDVGIRTAYYQGMVYNVLAGKFGVADQIALEELHWLADSVVEAHIENGARYLYIRYAALDAFVALAKHMQGLSRAKQIAIRVSKSLDSVVHANSLLDPTDRAVAEEAIAELSETFDISPT